MTGPSNDPQDRKIAPRIGGSAAYRAFLREELMPQVRQLPDHRRARADR